MRIQAVFSTLMTASAALAAPPESARGPHRWWVYFRDKGYATPAAENAAIDALATTYNARTVHRRTLRRTDAGIFDFRDLPVADSYLLAVAQIGASPRIVSRWLNAVSVEASADELGAIAALDAVNRIEPVRTGRRIESAIDVFEPLSLPEGPQSRGFYGLAEAQIGQIGVIPVHTQGFTAAGVIVGILDTGFFRAHEAFNNPSHPLQVVAEHDFINNDANTGPQGGDPGDQHIHGTLILGTLGAYLPDTFVGTAYDAAFVLCKTEDVSSETPIEEDNYVAGLEFIEQNGGDVATSSLGYIDWYTQADLDGATAVTSIAVNIATANGVHCCTAAGNFGNDTDPGTSRLIAPADAFGVLTCGAVDVDGNTAGFSSDGPSADGRIKPELLARGVDTVSVAADGSNNYWAASGTSLSTPLVAGAVACLTQARPDWTVDQMRSFLLATASDQVANGHADPLSVRGFGILNAAAALARDCNANGVDDSTDIATAASFDCNGNGVPDECECGGDLNGDCEVSLPDLAMLLAHFGQTSGASFRDGDMNHDGAVDLADLALMLARFGATCA